MARSLTCQGMRNLVQQNLLDFWHGRVGNEVLAEGDAALGVVAQTHSADRSVEPKGVVHKAMLLKKIHG